MNAWLLFSQLRSIPTFTIKEDYFVEFTAWRFFCCGVGASSINTNLYGIRYYYLKNKQTPPPFHEFTYLYYVKKGIRRLQTVHGSTIPLTRKVIHKIVQTTPAGGTNWVNYTFNVMTLFAFQFGLRCQDYTKGRSSPYPTKETLTLDQTSKSLTFKILKSKSKQKAPPEIIKFKCQCSQNNCIYCILLKYQQQTIKRKIQCDAFFTKKNAKGHYSPFCAHRFRDILSERLTIIYGVEYQPTRHRAHGIRHGRASELVRNGTPLEVARRVLRHAEGSIVISRYIHLTPDEIAEQVAQYDQQL